MSGAHADSERPRLEPHDRRDVTLAETNDPTALNGGPARHWYDSSETEPLKTPRRGTKVATSIFLWGVLLAGVLFLMAAL